MNAIRKHRMAKGYSQEKLAELLGVTQTQVCKWETGKALPSARNLKRISEELDMQPLEILEGA